MEYTVFATSSGVPSLPTGISSIIEAISSESKCEFILVSMIPHAIPLT